MLGLVIICWFILWVVNAVAWPIDATVRLALSAAVLAVLVVLVSLGVVR